MQSENVLLKYKMNQFIKILEKVEPIEEFNMDLFFRIVEKMTVFEREKIIVSLLDGSDVEIVIE
ncbi:hypothetical protein [Clostridium kluyveri]|uniref:hypothetical protein n=1 Tax=Clostridium kluyveri TaxID=1534 RepID=UPI0009F814B4|nr:hypothetical protein [Clostridium kluyveri]UZQ48977.1 hypothetical protein OP486_13420 [Clostridium kluyveri]